MTEIPNPTKTLDARGLQCPLPILRTKKEIKKMAIGDIIEVLSSDPGSKEDFPRWSKRTGNELITIIDEEDHSRYCIKRLV